MNAELRTTNGNDLKAFLAKHQDAIRSVAPATLTPDRMVRLVCAAASRDQQLAKCTPLSILRAMTQAASMGLEPFDGRNEVHLVPRWNKKINAMEATCLIGYPGLIRLATDTGRVRNIEARVVYELDGFEVKYGDTPSLEHKPSWKKDRGPIVAVYAVAFMEEGHSTFEVMPIYEVEEIRDRAKDGKDGFSPWKSDFAEMARKTAVRRLCKYLPKSAPLAAAMELQAKAEAGDFFETEPIRPGDGPGPVDPWLVTFKLEGGEEVTEWSDYAKTEFQNALENLSEACIAAGLSETETNKKMDHYKAKRGSEHPSKIISQILNTCDRLAQKEPA